jgi:hypothetical protein
VTAIRVLSAIFPFYEPDKTPAATALRQNLQICYLVRNCSSCDPTSRFNRSHDPDRDRNRDQVGAPSAGESRLGCTRTLYHFPIRTLIQRLSGITKMRRQRSRGQRLARKARLQSVSYPYAVFDTVARPESLVGLPYGRGARIKRWRDDYMPPS